MATATKKKPDQKPLTDKQEQFCLEYLIDFNATQAAIRAGYAKPNAHVIAAQNLSKLNIAARLAELKAERREDNSADAERVLEELRRLSYTNITDVVEFNESGATFIKDSGEIDPAHASAIESIGFKEDNSGVSMKLKMHSKPQALGMLAKHYGLLTEKVEITGDAGFANVLAEALNRAAQAKKDIE